MAEPRSLANLRPDKHHFPNWNPALAGDMRTETIAFFKEIVWKQNRPLSNLLNAHHASHAAPGHYGLPTIAKGEGPQRYDLTKVPARGGLLTQGSILTRGGDDASMVTRGLFVMHDLLRGVVKDPPPCVDTTPVASQPGLSQRSIAEKRIANANCGVATASSNRSPSASNASTGSALISKRTTTAIAFARTGKSCFPAKLSRLLIVRPAN